MKKRERKPKNGIQSLSFEGYTKKKPKYIDRTIF